MEEDRNDLLSQRGIDGVSSLHPERRSCGQGISLAGVSVLVGLLLAGQAVIGYFVYQQNNQISKLTKNTQELQLKSLADSLPHNSKSGPKMKMAMMSVMPLAMRDIPNGHENLEDVTKLTNSTEDQVKRILLQSNPIGKFPELKGSFMENMKKLRKLMTYEDWKAFETWMNKWLLFEMAQNKPEVIPAARGKMETQVPENLTYSGLEEGL